MTASVPAKTLQVLLVEDCDADAQLIVHAMKHVEGGAEVDIVSTRKQFTERLARRIYDLVLADYRLPNWTGMDALLELRRLGFDTPLILVTGELADELAVQSVKGGAADYVLKENLTRLPIAALRAVLDQRGRDESLRAQRLMKNAQQHAREHEERFLQLAENIDELFFVMNAQHTETLYINPAYEKIWGRSCQSLYDDPKSFVEAVPPDDQERLLLYMGRIQRGDNPGKIEYRVLRPDGEVRWLLVHAAPIRNEQGEVYRIAGVGLDVTDSRKTESELEESSERFRKLAQASFDAILITQDGFVYDVNRGHADMFGYSSIDEVIGRPITDFVAEESLADVERRFVNHIEGTYQLVGLRKDGRRILLEATGATHVIGGRPARITALRDITERRSLEDQFRQAQKMEAVGRLAGGVAHDFNNLLTVIMSYTDMLSEGLAVQDPRADDLDQIRKAAVTATSLTRQLLAFSRHQVIEPRLVNLSEVVSMSNKLLNRLIGEDIDVVTTITKDPVAVLIDPGQLEQVIMNLAVNARDAMPRGGRLTLETASVKIDADYARDQWLANSGRFAMLAVTDTGVGMDEATLARIFEPFFTTKEVGKGTGLGLATVFGIIKQSNGFIRVNSEIGRGTTFKIYLPLVDKPTEPYDGQPELVQLPVGTETILLAEDAAAVRAAARQILERYGYTVLEAPSGRDALNIALKRQAPIHLLLTDVVMPEMSGRELAEQFCELRPSAKVLYMSGYTDDAVVLHGILSADIAYLQKPFSPATLARKVREVLDAAPITATTHS
jgi:two-component system, cell cycle sensor histidine kinase and response regulator CckA